MSNGFVRLTKTSSSGGAGVTAVIGTAPIASSGGATPAISIPAATTSVNGYLSAVDWNTFNNKQDALVSGTDIRTINSNSVLGSGNIATGFSGFKYNVQVYYGLSPAPAPPSGVAYALYFDDGEGGFTYSGWNISYIDANGNDIGSLIFANVNLQPFSIFTPLGTYCLVQVQGSTIISGFGYQFSSSAFIGVSPETLNLTEGYFNFGTSQSVPTYNGYAMVGNLLGATFAAGSTSYIGIGASTANTTESLRAVALVTSQGFVSDFFVTTTSIMTGTMVITIMRNGLAVGGGSYTIPNGSAALKYPLGIQTTAPNGTTISLRIVQSTSTSAGISQFGWTAK